MYDILSEDKGNNNIRIIEIRACVLARRTIGCLLLNLVQGDLSPSTCVIVIPGVVPGYVRVFGCQGATSSPFLFAAIVNENLHTCRIGAVAAWMGEWRGHAMHRPSQFGTDGWKQRDTVCEYYSNTHSATKWIYDLNAMTRPQFHSVRGWPPPCTKTSMLKQKNEALKRPK